MSSDFRLRSRGAGSSIEQIEHPAELDHETAPRCRSDDVLERVRLVEHDEQSGVRALQPAKAQVERPDVGTIVVLKQALNEHAGRERIGDARLYEVRDEAPAGEID